MPVVSRVDFLLVDWAARRGLAEDLPSHGAEAKQQATRRGIRGETYAYWFLRRHGYTLVARNFKVPGLSGEIDLIGYDRGILAFVEVKMRSGGPGVPEDAVTREKRRVLSRIARQFLAARRIPEAPCRFDILAIEAPPGRRPVVRLHKAAFAGS
ncbi:MAG: YraN family protein [Candidatus Acidiferrales bacterium]